jgi:SAM-dependent methyltransferase
VRERRPSLLELGGVAILVVALAVLLYRDYERETGPYAAASEHEARRKMFETAYDRHWWGRDEAGKGTSGAGSTLEATRLYRVFLQDFLAAHRIRSVVDAGCGDWEFSQAIDWAGIDYLGVDIVPGVIAANQARFGRPNVRFAVADIAREPLPPADLLIVKDVLMHLSDADITRFLVQLPRYRHVLIVNDVYADTLSASAGNVPSGGYRPLDVTQPPYSLPGAKLLVWRAGGALPKLVVHLARR